MDLTTLSFNDYNTEDVYNDKDSSAKGLVTAYKRDNPNGSYDDFFSKVNAKWDTDNVKKAAGELLPKKSYKTGGFSGMPTNVQNELNIGYKGEPEQKTTPEKVLDTVLENSEKEEPKKDKNTTTTPISEMDKRFADQQEGIADYGENNEVARQKEFSSDRWNQTSENMRRMGEEFGNIDDKLVGQLPTFMFRRYQNGDFGDPKSKDAKLRLAHFMLNGLQTQLRRFSNGAAIAAGKSPLYPNEMSDYEKYQSTNLAKGLENRWNKYNRETQAAMDMAINQGGKEEELKNAIATISANNRLASKFNMMNESQKAYTLNVMAKLGKEISNMNDKDFVNTLVGYVISGDTLSWQELAEILAARYGKDAIKMIGSKVNNANENLGDNAEEQTAGYSGTGKSTEGYSVTLSDGTVVNPGRMLQSGEYKEITKIAKDLSGKYRRGEITEEQFRADYGKLEELMKQHPIANKFGTIRPVDVMIKENNKLKTNDITSKYTELQNNVKAGKVTPSQYEEEYKKLEEQAKSIRLTDMDIKGLIPKLSKDKILKYAEKANKNKKK